MDFDKKTTSITITFGTMIKAVLVLILMYFLYLISDIIMVLFVSLIFASALDPWVDWLQTKKVPRAFSMILIYALLLSLVGFILVSIVPPIAKEFGDLVANFPNYVEKLNDSFSSIKNFGLSHGLISDVGSGLGFIDSNLQGAAGGLFSTVSGIFGSIVSFFLILVLTFYMVVEENAIKKLVWSLAPVEHQPYIMNLLNRIQKKIGLWLRGQLILSLVIFLMAYIGLLVMGVKYALVLALIAGITEFVPYLGPILGAVPAVFLAFTQSPLLALFVGIFYYVIQWTENNILVPKVMEKTVGLNPIISITVMLVGFQLAGIIGAIMSIPVATAASVIVGDIFDSRKREGDAEFE